jgi:hypothetical protein
MYWLSSGLRDLFRNLFASARTVRFELTSPACVFEKSPHCRRCHATCTMLYALPPRFRCQLRHVMTCALHFVYILLNGIEVVIVHSRNRSVIGASQVVPWAGHRSRNLSSTCRYERQRQDEIPNYLVICSRYTKAAIGNVDPLSGSR